MDLSEVHTREIEMLKYFNSFCKSNNLLYMIDGGTLLGSIRHGGFIPWDDDVDVIMMRSQYERLKSLGEKFENENYRLLFIENTSDYYYPFIKMIDKRTKLIEYNLQEIEELGLFIDVFPIDNLPNSKLKKTLFIKSMGIVRRLRTTNAQLSTVTSNKIKKIFFPIVKKISIRFLAKVLDKFSQKYNSEKSSECANLVGNPRENFFSNSWFQHINYSKFESLNLPIPGNYIAYLEVNYGDYMKLPPVEQRINHGLNIIKRH